MKINLLDHGYIELVEHWGSDERIIEAARMSTQKGFEGWGPRCPRCKHAYAHENVQCLTPGCQGGLSERESGDERLLKYLYENHHATPFEMAGLIIEVQAPIFVFREWHRHRTQSYSEMSARYTPLPDVNYIPTIERLMINTGANKQAGAIKEAEQLTPTTAELFQRSLQAMYDLDEIKYRGALKEGVPKELARLFLPVGRYSRMRASANLRNWLAFLTLRCAPNAQWEIRQYANALSGIISEHFPRTMALFDERHVGP